MIFRKWSALSTIAGALERKVWVKTNKGVTYPHEYILLVGGPGVGKSESIRHTEKFLRDLPNVHLAPTSVSKASLMDALSASERTIVRPGDLKPVISYNSMTVCASEFGAFLVSYEGDFMSALNKLYDNEFYDERKRHMRKGEPLIIKNPQLNLLAGTTPGWLISNLPAQAWNEGFTSRLILIYGKETVLTDPFAKYSTDEALSAALAHDLSSIQNLYGEIEYSLEAQAIYKKWYMTGQHPVPDHAKLADYLPRRARHLHKLAMLLAVSENDDLIITADNLNSAMSLLFEAESQMPFIFRDMHTGGDSHVLEEVYGEITRLFIRDQQPVPEYMIISFISKRVPAYGVRKIFEVLLDSNMIKVASAVGVGGKPTYAPTRPKDHNL